MSHPISNDIVDTERYRYVKNFPYKFPVYMKNNRYREIIVMWKFVIERVYCSSNNNTVYIQFPVYIVCHRYRLSYISFCHNIVVVLCAFFVFVRCTFMNGYPI